MPSAISVIPTQAGLQASFNATSDGLQMTITHIALGDAGWTPDDSATALRNEIVRVPIAEGQLIAPNEIAVTALADGPEAFYVREFAVIADGSTVLAIWSDETTILAYKSALVQLVFTQQLILNAYPPDSITVESVNLDLNLTVTAPLAQLATAIISAQHREVLDMVKRRALEQRLEALEASP
ncbi:MAG: hypothetical protein ETSY1_46835 (plasmid) [Candidatus Entotheonella factor]|uniref:Phage tail fibre protein N-terminal domain-containing protein n=1 Tax=Entotheonella factor TaxID=1429438 RepID=W4M0S8_ENTF1|nr:MAG: hypothetical protein ETSY1_46835 [Candidatus Entotheonella factor]